MSLACMPARKHISHVGDDTAGRQAEAAVPAARNPKLAPRAMWETRKGRFVMLEFLNVTARASAACRCGRPLTENRRSSLRSRSSTRWRPWRDTGHVRRRSPSATMSGLKPLRCERFSDQKAFGVGTVFKSAEGSQDPCAQKRKLPRRRQGVLPERTGKVVFQSIG